MRGCAFLQKKLLLIINPISGRGLIKDHLLSIVQKLSQAEYDATVYPTKAKGDAIEKVKTAQGYDLVIASGGDGTLNEVITGMIEAEVNVPIGYLPAGTTNDFASTLNIPKNVSKALDVCLEGNPIPIDIGNFNDQYFTYVAAFGAFTDVSYETPQPRKNVLGGLAYLVEGLLKLPTIQSYRCKISHSGGVLEGEYIFGMVSNSDSVAGIKNAFGNCADLSDGLFEVTLIKSPKNLLDIHRILDDFLNKKYDPECVTTFKTDAITFECEEKMKWTLDGESGGSLNKIQIKNLKKRVQILA